VVVVSHDERLRTIADRTVSLEDGRITKVEEAAPPLGPLIRRPS